MAQDAAATIDRVIFLTIILKRARGGGKKLTQKVASLFKKKTHFITACKKQVRNEK